MPGSKVELVGVHDVHGPESTTACFKHGEYIGDRMDRLLVNGCDIGDIESLAIMHPDPKYPREDFLVVQVRIFCSELVITPKEVAHASQ